MAEEGVDIGLSTTSHRIARGPTSASEWRDFKSDSARHTKRGRAPSFSLGPDRSSSTGLAGQTLRDIKLVTDQIVHSIGMKGGAKLLGPSS